MLQTDNIPGRLEGLLLVCVGAYLAWLLSSDNLWQMLNPRFFWLETVAAGGLVLCGAVLAAAPARTSALRLGSLVALCLLLGVTLWGPEGMALPSGTAEEPFAVEEPKRPGPLELGGQTFERITTPELVQLLAKDSETAVSGKWVMRGMAARSEALDARDSFALLRPLVWCCLADTVAVGMVVPWEGELPEPGQWVQVAGRAERLQDPDAWDLELSLGPYYVALDDAFMFTPAGELGAEAMQLLEDPELPFVFDVRETPPFSW